MNVDGDIVDGGRNGQVLSDGVIGEQGVGGEEDEGDGVMNEGDESSTTRVTRTVLSDKGVIWEESRFLVDLCLDSCIHATIIFFEWRREDNS